MQLQYAAPTLETQRVDIMIHYSCSYNLHFCPVYDVPTYTMTLKIKTLEL